MGTELTLAVLSQEPVTTMLFMLPTPSIHRAHLMGASWPATCMDCPVFMSSRRPALSAPPEKTLLPSCHACCPVQCQDREVWIVGVDRGGGGEARREATSRSTWRGRGEARSHKPIEPLDIACSCPTLLQHTHSAGDPASWGMAHLPDVLPLPMTS